MGTAGGHGDRWRAQGQLEGAETAGGHRDTERAQGQLEVAGTAEGHGDSTGTGGGSGDSWRMAEPRQIFYLKSPKDRTHVDTRARTQKTNSNISPMRHVTRTTLKPRPPPGIVYLIMYLRSSVTMATLWSLLLLLGTSKTSMQPPNPEPPPRLSSLLRLRNAWCRRSAAPGVRPPARRGRLPWAAERPPASCAPSPPAAPCRPPPPSPLSTSRHTRKHVTSEQRR